MVRKVQLRLKWLWGDVLAKLGVPFRSKGREGETRVLCFHGICRNEDPFINGRFLHQEQFDSLLKAICSEFHLISLEECCNNQRNPEKINVLLTFDDGYRNNLTLALPILEKYRAAATIFCTSRTLIWTDLIDIARYEKVALSNVFDVFPELNGKTYDAVKQWALQQKKETLDRFTLVLKECVTPYLEHYRLFWELMDDNDLLKMQKHPLISLANHGADHLSYVHCSTEEFLADFEACKTRLEKVNASHATIFAYPFGHYSEATHAALKERAPIQFTANGDPATSELFHDRLVINPYISVRNQLTAIRDGTY